MLAGHVIIFLILFCIRFDLALNVTQSLITFMWLLALVRDRFQGLSDSEEFVIYKAIVALKSLVIADIVKKSTKYSLLSEVSR